MSKPCAMKPMPVSICGGRPCRAPQAAILAGEAVPVLAGLGLPGADAVLGPPHLDHAGQALVEGDPPVPAVGRHIHQPPALIEIALHGVPHPQGMVLGVGAGDDAADRAAAGRAPSACRSSSVITSNGTLHVRLEPVEQVRVGIELPQARARGAQPGAVARPQVQDRPQARGVGRRRCRRCGCRRASGRAPGAPAGRRRTAGRPAAGPITISARSPSIWLWSLA